MDSLSAERVFSPETLPPAERRAAILALLSQATAGTVILDVTPVAGTPSRFAIPLAEVLWALDE